MVLKGQKFHNYDNSANTKDAILEEYKLKRIIAKIQYSRGSYKSMGIICKKQTKT